MIDTNRIPASRSGICWQWPHIAPSLLRADSASRQPRMAISPDIVALVKQEFATSFVSPSDVRLEYQPSSGTQIGFSVATACVCYTVRVDVSLSDFIQLAWHIGIAR